MAVLEQVVEADRPFAVRVQPARERVYVRPDGELDLATVPELHDQVQELVEVGFEQVIVDLRALVFIDVAGFRLLVALTDQAHDEGWRLSLIQGSSQVRRLCAVADTSGRLLFCSATSLAA
jgi:anti-anti-sigma factor